MKMTSGEASPALVSHWWQEYIASDRKNDLWRNKLVENYLPIVKHTAEWLHTKLPEEVDVDDLILAGVFGLMDAVNRFDPNRNIKFKTYCSSRIRGAMLDELRDMDWVPRLVRSRASKLNKATRVLQARVGREPTHAELARHMMLSTKEFKKLERDAHAVVLVPLDRKRFKTDSHKNVREIDFLKDKRTEDPTRSVKRDLLKELIIKGLNKIEQLIIIWYYFDEMTIKEIGEVLGICESRVSQMHRAILGRLRERLNLLA